MNAPVLKFKFLTLCWQKLTRLIFSLKVEWQSSRPAFCILSDFSYKQPVKVGKDRPVPLLRICAVLVMNMVSFCRVVKHSSRLGFILLVASCPDCKEVGWGLEYLGKLWSEHYISCDGISPDQRHKCCGRNLRHIFFPVWTLRHAHKQKCCGHIFHTSNIYSYWKLRCKRTQQLVLKLLFRFVKLEVV